METLTVCVNHCRECHAYTEPADRFCNRCGAQLPMRFTRTALTGHTSADTAYLVNDYPYGYRLRCQIRYWLEYKRGHGFRFVSQTSNPKKPGTVWNKPKASTYVPVAVLVRNDDGHISYDALGMWEKPEVIDAFEAAHANALTDDHRHELREMRIMNAAAKHITYTVRHAGTYHVNTQTGTLDLDPTSEGAEHAHEPAQSREEVAAVWNAAIARALTEVS